MDNGCACCSIRGDLVRTLGGLVEKRQQFDAVMLETTGLADPAPIIATLKSNQWIDDNFAIDAVFCGAERQVLLQFGVSRGTTVACAARRSCPSFTGWFSRRSFASRRRSTSRRTSRSRSRTVSRGVLLCRVDGVGAGAELLVARGSRRAHAADRPHAIDA